jgi:hypothetical protein
MRNQLSLPLKNLRVILWCELLKAVLENRPYTLLPRRGTLTDR